MKKEDWGKDLNRLDWECSGYRCALRRDNDIGVWCGYVGVPLTHPLYGIDCDDIYEESASEEAMMEIEVHGGLTYSDREILDNPTDEETWWFGFDCGHFGDIMPFLADVLPNSVFANFGEYKDIEYVKKETENLAVQLKKVEDWAKLEKTILPTEK
jgi:hypothetical protein